MTELCKGACLEEAQAKLALFKTGAAAKAEAIAVAVLDVEVAAPVGLVTNVARDLDAFRLADLRERDPSAQRYDADCPSEQG